LRYFSTSMLVSRPCLREFTTDKGKIPFKTSSSKNMDLTAAIQCVSSARSILRLFPDIPNIPQMYDSTPWWCVLHFLVQAGAVLVLELYCDTTHLIEEPDVIINDAGKLLRWLHALAPTSLAAQRAWTALSRLLHLTLSRIGQDASSLSAFMPTDTTQLPGEHNGTFSSYLSVVSHTPHYRSLEASLPQPAHLRPRFDIQEGFVQGTNSILSPLVYQPVPIFPPPDMWIPQQHITGPSSERVMVNGVLFPNPNQTDQEYDDTSWS
jgi:hypothetical protein